MVLIPRSDKIHLIASVVFLTHGIVVEMVVLVEF